MARKQTITHEEHADRMREAQEEAAAQRNRANEAENEIDILRDALTEVAYLFDGAHHRSTLTPRQRYERMATTARDALSATGIDL